MPVPDGHLYCAQAAVAVYFHGTIYVAMIWARVLVRHCICESVFIAVLHLYHK